MHVRGNFLVVWLAGCAYQTLREQAERLRAEYLERNGQLWLSRPLGSSLLLEHSHYLRETRQTLLWLRLVTMRLSEVRATTQDLVHIFNGANAILGTGSGTAKPTFSFWK